MFNLNIKATAFLQVPYALLNAQTLKVEFTTEQSFIEGCRKKDSNCQKLLYKHFFAYAMKICLRYAPDRDEAVEIVNDGFMKVFTKINTYNSDYAFKTWLGKIMINTAIDYYRSGLKKMQMEDLEKAKDIGANDFVFSNLYYEDLIKMVQKLSLAYRTVFNLFVIDGFSHEEIAEKLSITVGTSKSNLFKARLHLKEMLKTMGEDRYNG